MGSCSIRGYDWRFSNCRNTTWRARSYEPWFWAWFLSRIVYISVNTSTEVGFKINRFCGALDLGCDSTWRSDLWFSNRRNTTRRERFWRSCVYDQSIWGVVENPVELPRILFLDMIDINRFLDLQSYSTWNLISAVFESWNYCKEIVRGNLGVRNRRKIAQINWQCFGFPKSLDMWPNPVHFWTSWELCQGTHSTLRCINMSKIKMQKNEEGIASFVLPSWGTKWSWYLRTLFRELLVSFRHSRILGFTWCCVQVFRLCLIFWNFYTPGQNRSR